MKNNTVLFITHEPLEALRLADVIYVLTGSPTYLHSSLHLTTPTPRELGDPDVLSYQAKLLHILVSAMEKT